MIGASELAVFAAVVSEGSFTAAAEKTGLSKTVVSKKITALEESLETQLLYRTTRQLSLTSAGKVLFQYAQGIDQQAQQAFSAVHELSKEVSGNIRMSVPTISGELLLADVVSDFCKKYPKVNVELVLENKLVNLLEQQVDLAIRTATLEDSSLIATHIIKSNWVVCASPEYLNGAGELSDLDHLEQHNCLRYNLQQEGSSEWRFTKDDTTHCIKVSGSFASNNAQSLKKAALAGLGLIYVPKCSVYPELTSGKLETVLNDYQARSLGVYAVYPYTRHRPKSIELLVDEIKNSYVKMREQFE